MKKIITPIKAWVEDDKINQELTFWFNANPRKCVPKEFEKFMKFCKEFYKDRDNVNWLYAEDVKEQLKNVEDYIHNCIEALLLFKKYKAIDKLKEMKKNE